MTSPTDRSDMASGLARMDALWQEGRAGEAAELCRLLLCREPGNPTLLGALAITGFDHDRDAGRTATLLLRALSLPGNRALLLPMLGRVVSFGLRRLIALYREGRAPEAEALASRLAAARDRVEPEVRTTIDQLIVGRAAMERRVALLKERLSEAALARPLEEHCLILLYGGIGDQIATLGFLAHLHRRDGLPFMVVTTANNLPLARMYSGPHCGGLVGLGESINPWGLLSSMRLAPGHPFLAWISLHFNSEDFEAGGSTKMEFYRRALGVEPGTPVAPPVPGPDAIRRAEERFAALGAPRGRTVILAPHANTIGSLPDSWWAAAERHLRAAGYTVLVNGANNARSFDHHRNRSAGTLEGLQGTEVHIPLDEMIPFTELAGHFLGVRSGLCDLVAFARARIDILYPAGRGADGAPQPAFGGRDGFESVRRCYRPVDCGEHDVPVDEPFSPALLSGWAGMR